MIVKNVSGETRYFGFSIHGQRTVQRGKVLVNNGLATISDSDPVVLAKVQSYVAAGVLQIIEGPSQATLVSSVNSPASGYIYADGAAANADFVTVSGLKFKFAASPGDAALGHLSASLVAYWAGAGAGAATAMGTLRTALNINTAATGIIADPVVTIGSVSYIPLRATNGVVANTGLTLVRSGTHVLASDTILAAGSSGAAKRTANLVHAASANDVTAGLIILPTALNSISIFDVQILRAGVGLAWDGVAQKSGGSLVLDNSGTTDWQAADVITVFAQE